MIIFFTNRIVDNYAFFDEEEFKHCIKVLRHKRGDSISFIDGCGGNYTGEITEIKSKEFSVLITSVEKEPGLPYNLNMAVAPTKNSERFEWFVEKAVEIGVNEISPVIGDFSERKVYKTERAKRVVMSAVKQSLKSYLPAVNEAVKVSEFIESKAGSSAMKLIGYCEECNKVSLAKALTDNLPQGIQKNEAPVDIIVLIGPEGDFSTKEVELAVKNGFKIIHLGASRLRTETAALFVVSSVYLHSMDYSPNSK